MFDDKPENPREIMNLNLAALREYAASAIQRGETLSADQEADKDTRLREFLATGESFKLTPKEMVALVCRGMTRRNKECTCRPCSSMGDD